MNPQRIILLTISVIFCGVGISMASQSGTELSKFSGILIRIGLTLFVFWIAFPQLDALRNRMSLFVLVVILLFLLIVAARPQIFPIALAVALGSIFLNGLMRRFSGKLPARRKPHSDSTED